MATFKISKATDKRKTWQAEGVNPVTARMIVIQGGQAGVEVGSKNPKKQKSFHARNDATKMTPRKYVNKLRWDDQAEFGFTVNIPDKLFKKKPKPKS